MAVDPEDWKKKVVELHRRWLPKGIEPFSALDKCYTALLLAGETGELCNIIQKWWRGDGTLSVDHLAEEMADVRASIELLAYAFEIDLDIECTKKMQIVEGRIEAAGR